MSSNMGKSLLSKQYNVQGPFNKIQSCIKYLNTDATAELHFLFLVKFPGVGVRGSRKALIIFI